MSLVTALVYAVLSAIAHVFPIGGIAVLAGIPERVLGWEPLAGSSVESMVFLGLSGALFALFGHDWLSTIAATIRMLATRKPPRSIDDRLFGLMAIAIGVGVSLDHWFDRSPESVMALRGDGSWGPVALVAGLLGGAALLSTVDAYSRKKRSLFDLGALEAILIGIALAVSPLPGVGPLAAVLFALLARNFSRESAIKLTFLALGPWTLYQWMELPEVVRAAPSGVRGLAALVVAILAWIVADAFRIQFTKFGIRNVIAARVAVAAAVALSFAVKF